MNHKKAAKAELPVKPKQRPLKPTIVSTQVVNSAAHAIPVHAGRPLGWQPMFCGSSLLFADGQKTIQATAVITSPTLVQVDTVPAGKRLVIEYVTADIEVPKVSTWN